MRFKPAYYSVLCLRDGTVLHGHQIRKPRGSRSERDGVSYRYVRKAESFAETCDRETIICQLAIVNRLNTRQAIRDLLLPRLDAIERRLSAIEDRLARG